MQDPSTPTWDGKLRLYLPVAWQDEERSSWYAKPEGALLEMDANLAARICHLAELACRENLTHTATPVACKVIGCYPAFAGGEDMWDSDDPVVLTASAEFDAALANPDLSAHAICGERLRVERSCWSLRFWDNDTGVVYESANMPLPRLPFGRDCFASLAQAAT